MNDQDLIEHLLFAHQTGRLKAPHEPPSPELTRRLQAFTETFNVDVAVLATTPTRISTIMSPRDGSPRFLLAFDAMASVPQSGPSQ
jgi:hypothetical protein